MNTANENGETQHTGKEIPPPGHQHHHLRLSATKIGMRKGKQTHTTIKGVHSTRKKININKVIKKQI